ncbi:MAG: nucleotide sugar dehydrogenase [Candidatus Methanomethylicia archaeon]|nr:nucleotide sugar dehydrogenase [Candidatus Methanomethylicia archaeon]
MIISLADFMLFGLSDEKIFEVLNRGEVNIAVYGLGRIGLPLAIAWLRAGQRVLGVDVNRNIVDKINIGLSPILDEPLIPEYLSMFVKLGKFKATTDLIEASKLCEVKFVAVPTGIVNGRFNVENLVSALKAIGKGLKKGDAVCIESTVPPTTTETLAKSILESESGLIVEEDFALAHSPERIYGGRALDDLENRYPKIVGGIGPKSTRFFSLLYRRIAKRGVIVMSSARAAEFSKIFEGIYRDVNIALVNELSSLCNVYNVDFFEIRNASNSQPFCNLHKPGVGVGGPCIPVYPYFLIEKASEVNLKLDLTLLSRKINENMPIKTISLIMEFLKKFNVDTSKIKIAILGLAFRGNIADSRLSPTYDLINLLKPLGFNIIVHDPYISEDQILISKNIPLTNSIEDAIKDTNIVLIATDHDIYYKLNWNLLSNLMIEPKLLFDGRGVVDISKLPKDLNFMGIGRPSIFIK